MIAAGPHETDVIEALRDLGLDLRVIFNNKGAVMILPGGANKATGLMTALDELSLSRHLVFGRTGKRSVSALCRETLARRLFRKPKAHVGDRGP